MKKTVLSLMFLLALTGGAVPVVRATGQYLAFENPLLGKPAPDFTLKTLGAGDVNLAAFRAQGPALIFFWATWCPHCREQLAELSPRIDEIEQKGIKVLLLDLGENEETVKKYVSKRGIREDRVFLDVDSAVAEQYGIIGVPTFFFVDRSGIVKSVEHSLPEDFEKILLSSEQSHAGPH